MYSTILYYFLYDILTWRIAISYLTQKQKKQIEISLFDPRVKE